MKISPTSDLTYNIAILHGNFFVSSSAKSGNQTLTAALVNNGDVALRSNIILQRSPTTPREGTDPNLGVP